MNLTRRDFLATTAVAALGSAAAVRAADPPAKAIIDTHTHFWDPTRPEGIHWPAKGDKLYKKVLPADFRAATGPFGVTGTVIVEASPRLEDNQWLLDIADKDPFVPGVVGNLKPGETDFGAHLKRFCAHKKFRGIRINGGTLEKQLENEAFAADLKALSELDRELDVLGVPPMLPGVDKLAAKLPGLRILINHCSNVRIDGKEPPADWVTNIQACAKHKLMYCKVSALGGATGKRDGTAPADVAFYKPVLDTLWNAFGEDRLIYGSDWPLSDFAIPYDRMLGVVGKYFKDKSQTAADKFFAGNALAAYKYEVPG